MFSFFQMEKDVLNIVLQHRVFISVMKFRNGAPEVEERMLCAFLVEVTKAGVAFGVSDVRFFFSHSKFIGRISNLFLSWTVWISLWYPNYFICL